MTIAPPFAYYGGKTRMADAIAQLLPAHGHYVEPFGGSLAVLLAKPRSTMETVNDLDADLMTFWRVLRDQPAELERRMALTPHSRAEHQEALDALPADDVERARRVWVRLSQGRAGRLRRTGWRHFVNSASNAVGLPEYLDAYAERVPACARRLHGVTLECRPAAELIADYGQHGDVLIYADPPYLASTRNGLNYQHEMSGDAEHEALAEQLHGAAAAVVLSGYPSPLYNALYADWHRVDLAAWTGNGIRGSATKAAGDRTEMLWSNRPLREPDLFGDLA